ncbi:serine/threonine-protein kinase H2 [Monodelphis domestica]|uniref:Protein serine kinase H2 n=1 Tax=Monodelphis domestica TaxID=13616 RepID=F7ELA1_MONDO|nr:serine/threonine-protein kinase H2 [Monodelphis domestica]
MGCGTSSKVVPETSASAFHLSWGKGVGKGSYGPLQAEQWETGHRGQQVPPEAAVEAVQKMQVARYRAKFDPRVTARYTIQALIGRGRFSKVVRVEQRVTKKPFAIKMVETSLKEGREACESELSVLRRVSHCNIVQLIEIFEAQDRVYIVMELATGGELFDRIIAQGTFTERDAVIILKMVVDGVRYLHSLQITHRDLKPENLLYYHPGAESKILITDFGLSSSGHKNGDWSMSTLCGTPEYIAPEILSRKPYTNAVDMWALGVIAYVLLSGSLPFEDENPMRLYKKILKGKYSYKGEPWPNVSNLAKDFIDKLLTLDSGHRMSAGQALNHPWVMTMAITSPMKNLQRSISWNLMLRTSPHSQGSRSSRTSESCHSNGSKHTWRKKRVNKSGTMSLG